MKKTLFLLLSLVVILTSCELKEKDIYWQHNGQVIDTCCMIKNDTVYRYSRNLVKEKLNLIEKFYVEKRFYSEGLFEDHLCKRIAKKEDILCKNKQENIKGSPNNRSFLTNSYTLEQGYLIYNRSTDRYQKTVFSKKGEVFLIPVYISILIVFFLTVILAIRKRRKKVKLDWGDLTSSILMFIPVSMFTFYCQISIWMGILNAITGIFLAGLLKFVFIDLIIDGLRLFSKYAKRLWKRFSEIQFVKKQLVNIIDVIRNSKAKLAVSFIMGISNAVYIKLILFKPMSFYGILISLGFLALLLFTIRSIGKLTTRSIICSILFILSYIASLYIMSIF